MKFLETQKLANYVISISMHSNLRKLCQKHQKYIENSMMMQFKDFSTLQTIPVNFSNRT